MMIAIADTHTIIWYLASDARLSLTAREFINEALYKNHQIGISSVTLVEMVYLIERNKISPLQFTQLVTELSAPDSFLRECPLNVAVARALTKVNALQIPDMPDRIIAATAVSLEIPVISRDSKISLSLVPTIW
jgi:PIN domain nuclease of toxin-antitoxin system